MDSPQSPMTKFWCMKIKSPDIANAPQSPFNALLREILEFCYNSSGHSAARHEFWEEDVVNPSEIVMVTGYPTVESNVAADREYISSDRLPRMAEWVESGRLVKCLCNVQNAPLDAERLDFCIAGEGEGVVLKPIQGQDAVTWVGTELARGKAVGTVKVVMTPCGGGDPVPTAGQSVRLRKRLL